MTTYKATQVEISEDFGPYDAEVLVGERWNGFAIPRFTREVVAQMIEDTDRLRESDPDGYCEIRWLGNDVELIDNDAASEVIQPDADGMYSVGARVWTWTEVDDDDAEIEAAERRAYGRAEQYEHEPPMHGALWLGDEGPTGIAAFRSARMR